MPESTSLRPNDPRDVDNGPARPPVVRGSGLTASERYLAALAERSFLDLWSYPNVYIDKKSGGSGAGKELCDLLVVCGDDILIFSDKTVSWPEDDDLQLSWRRWYKRAVKKSVDQIRGAERWIEKYPDRLFVDPLCTQPFPLALPPVDRRRVHGIIVANGAVAACAAHLGEEHGSLMLFPSIRGDDHFVGENVVPFAVGDADPNGPFVHIFDEATLDVVMGELDTIADLTSYLTKKEALIRSGQLISAAGEEELVAHYLTSMNAEGEHDFVQPDGRHLRPSDRVIYEGGFYDELTRNSQYLAKKEADKISYCWDRLISNFTDHVLAGTSLMPHGQSPEVSDQERAVRYMALLSRFERRHYGAGVLGALEEGQRASRFARAFISGPGAPRTDTAFFYLTVKVPSRELQGGYAEYREFRTQLLVVYAYDYLRKNPQLERIVGVASEPKPSSEEESGSSEDLIYLETPEWTEEFLAELEQITTELRINQPENARSRNVSDQEFPIVRSSTASSSNVSGLNRKERRAVAAKRRQKRRNGVE